ncbi:hypothetical protein ARMGADRAFT_787379 [Armillaria gallica]|uniref:F-box domain-containing protein n=1 Tax=Armillaria gallica TaxID=47427 RepID=A0A2H3DM32_ARMGA|nr:hypothetical protein ARMGADRAFT_787379 [Armillaria gallica]
MFKAVLQSGWKPCSGCACSNHQIPSYAFQEDISLLHFAHLARSNVPPSPTEEEQLKEAISSYRQQIWDLDAEVLRLDVLLAHIQRPIQEKKETLRREKERVLTAIDDSRRVFRILAKIFHHTIEFPIHRSRDMSSHNSQWDSYFTGNPMWTIEAVSKQWRMVAMSFPELWSYINIVLTDLAEEWSLIYRKYLSEQVNRSRNHPLFVSIADGNEYRATKYPAQWLAKYLFIISPYIKELGLFLHSSAFRIKRIRLSLPSLEKVSLLFLGTNTFDHNEKLLLFPSAPKLQTLEVIGIDETTGYFVLPWHQITTCESYHSNTDCFNVGPTSLTHPENCTLIYEHNASDLEESNGGGVYPLTCARLRSLNLVSHMSFSYNRWATALKQILSRLTLPELTTLRVVCMSREEADTFTSIRELITTRSYCPITVLYFDHGTILEDEILHILRTTPTLEDVRLTHVDVSLDKTLAELTPKFDGTTALVPPSYLKVLHIGGNIVFDIGIFVDMVDARWNIPPLNFTSMQRLKEVHVYRLLEVNGWDNDGTNTDTALSTLNVYKMEGLNAVFSTEYTGDI